MQNLILTNTLNVQTLSICGYCVEVPLLPPLLTFWSGQISEADDKNTHRWAYYISVPPHSPHLNSLLLTWFRVRWVPVAGIFLQLHLLQCEYGYVCQRHKHQSVQKKSHPYILPEEKCLLWGCNWSPLCISFKLYVAEPAKSALLHQHFITHSLAACAHVAPGSWSTAASLLHQQRSSFLIRTEM